MSIAIQHCEACGAFNYPRHAVCGSCLSDALVAREVSGEGELIAVSRLDHSLDPAWRARLPVHLATVDLDCGVQVICFAPPDTGAPARVRLVPWSEDPNLWMAQPIDA